MTEPTACLGCGHQFVTEARLRGRDVDPVEGDVSVCQSCAFVAVFTGQGRATREPTVAEFVEIMADPLVAEHVMRVKFGRRIAVEEGRAARQREAGRRGLN